MQRYKTCGLSSRVITWEDRAAVCQMEDFVRNHEKSHFLQLPRWARVKEYWQWRGIVVYEDDCVAGVMSVLIRPLPMGFSLMYAPRGPVCDRNDPYVMAQLMGTADALAEEVKALELLLDPDEDSGNEAFRQIMDTWGFTEREDPGFGNVQAQHVFRLYLAGQTEASVLAGCCQKTRYNIRLAQRKGVRIRTYYGDAPIPEAELDAFQRIMEETGHRDRFIPRGKEYYKAVFRSLGPEAVLFMAYLEDTPIAGTIGVFSGGKGWYLYGASSDRSRNVMPNYLLQWQMICMAMERGCVFYDFRGVPGKLDKDDPLYGLYRFKKGFGGVYTKLTGLFVRRYRPVFARGFELALGLFRKLCTHKHCR